MVFPLVVFASVLLQLPTAGSARPEADLIGAAKLGDLTRARELVTRGAPVDVTDRRGYTPLMWSSAAGSVDLTRYLLEHGAHPGARAADGATALFLAAANGSTDVVRLLLSRGANPGVAREGQTPRQAAAARGRVETAAALEAAETLGGQLLQAASDGQGTFVRQLLARGAPANITNTAGVSPVMFAARNGDLGMLQFLLSRGADVFARDAQGLTALDWAEKSSSTGKYVVAFLKDRSPAPESRRPVSRPPPAIPDLLRAIDTMLAKAVPVAGDAREAHRRALSALSELRTLSANWPADSPEDYRDSLEAQATTLGAAIERNDAGVLREALAAVADDLEAKLEHCRKSGGRLGGSVLVRVRTVQAGSEASQWQVFYMPKIFEVAPSASPDLFPQLSSPTDDLLVPGRYLMWVRNPATNAVGERTVVKVGEGRKELIVDLPVPAAGK
jgi:ankyrin repeat protein